MRPRPRLHGFEDALGNCRGSWINLPTSREIPGLQPIKVNVEIVTVKLVRFGKRFSRTLIVAELELYMPKQIPALRIFRLR